MNRSINLETIRFRHNARAAIRSLFDRLGFIELETPYLITANTPDPFIDPIFAVSAGLGDRRLQLHTSPEIWLKKGLALGLEKIYHMARVFRDDPLGSHHNREFTMLEWYRVNAGLEDLIMDVEAIFKETNRVAQALGLSNHGDPAFVRCDLADLFRDLAGIDLSLVLARIRAGSVDALQQILGHRGECLPRHATFEDAFFHIMLKYVEPNLAQESPTVIARWPIQLAALARPCADNPDFCDRFEIYYQGMEIANAYQECADEEMLRSRFTADNREREKLGKPVFVVDDAFLGCMNNVPHTAGIALGIDRIFLAVLRKAEIAEVIFGFGDH